MHVGRRGSGGGGIRRGRESQKIYTDKIFKTLITSIRRDGELFQELFYIYFFKCVIMGIKYSYDI